MPRTSSSAAAATATPTFNCPNCKSDCVLKKGFNVSYKNVIISDFFRLRPVNTSKTASNRVVMIEEEMDWLPPIIEASEDEFDMPKWPTCLRNAAFMEKETKLCEECCVKVMDRVMEYSGNDGIIIKFPPVTKVPKPSVLPKKPAPAASTAVAKPPKPAPSEENAPPAQRKPRVPTFKKSVPKEAATEEDVEARTTDSFFVTGL